MRRRTSIEKSKYIKNKYKEYILSTFKFSDNRLQKLFIDQLDRENLFNGPFISLEKPFTRGNNLEELINEGVVCKSFRKLNDVDLKRPLYAHQEKAIRRIAMGHGAVVTTGTGSGKTECFLYPILNEILSERENGKHKSGIKALLLYPLNTLVNDQIERLRNMLKNCPEITYGFFTGDTPDSLVKAKQIRERHYQQYGEKLPDNELISREEIRKNPPDLLFSNYSMLEYMMLRPNDSPIFSRDKLGNWKFIVLDEAHTYSGARGIELSMLLRRVTALAENKPKFILTSATLGVEGKSENDIVEFANNLTTSNFSIDDIIFSKKIDLSGAIKYAVKGSDYLKLEKNINNIDIIKNICS